MIPGRSSRALRGWARGVAAVAAAAACAADPPATANHAAAITNGALDGGHPAVVGLVAGGLVFCTGTLVAPRVVVTAGHCIGRRELRVVFGGSLADGELRDVADQRAHPGFELIGLVDDIGVLLLAEPAPSEIAPVAMRRDALPESVVGEPLVVVGFGKTSAEPAAESGRKRVGTAMVTAVDAGSLALGAQPSQTCMGDSGGPALLARDGVDQLVGVTSSGDARCEQYGRDTRVDVHAAGFVLPYIAETSRTGGAAGERCFVADNCGSGVCEFPDDAPTIGYCAAPCAAPGDCPGEMQCDRDTARCRYPLPSPGAFAAACNSATDCDSRTCAQTAGAAEAMCTARCLPEISETCPASTVCVAEAPASAGSFVCAPRTDAGGCAIAPHSASPPWAGLLALALALARRRHRRTARRSDRGKVRSATRRRRSACPARGSGPERCSDTYPSRRRWPLSDPPR